jgi:hypothetical protein
VKKQKQNNQGAVSGLSTTAGASNTGASTGLKMAPAGGAPGTVGTMGPVSNANPYPRGLS